MFTSIKEFWQLTVPFKFRLGVLVVLLVVDAVLTALSVVTIAPLADLALERPQAEWLSVTRHFQIALGVVGVPFNLASVAVVFLFFTLGMSLFSVFVRYALVTLRVAVVGRLVKVSLSKIFNASWGYFSTSSSGLLLNTYVREVTNTGAAFQSLTLSATSIARVVAFISAPLLLEPLLVTLCLVAATLVLIPFMYLGKWSTRFGARDLGNSNRYTSLLKESLTAAREVIGFGREKRTQNQINDFYARYAESRVKSETFSFFSSQMFEPLGIMVILGVLVATKHVSDGLALSSVAVVLWGLIRTLSPLKQLISIKHTIDNRLPSLLQIKADQARADSFRQAPGGQRFDTNETKVVFDQVSFSYGGGETALDSISLEASANRMVALVGESGSGKSTVVDMLLGLQQPDSGDVYLNDVNSREIDLQQWREQLSVVPQRPILFDLTVRENLLWANPDATEDAIHRVLEITDCTGFVSRMPKGLDTEIGEAGIRLSGGQVQRLALARALIREPRILILDEATSALDTESESRIYSALPKATRNCLVIVVAHRLATVRTADQILVFQRGRLVEQGTYDSLNALGGYFHRLLHSRPSDHNNEPEPEIGTEAPYAVAKA